MDAREKGYSRLEGREGGGKPSEGREAREKETERRSGARGRMVRGDMGVPRVESNARAHAGGLARRLACIDQRA